MSSGGIVDQPSVDRQDRPATGHGKDQSAAACSVVGSHGSARVLGIITTLGGIQVMIMVLNLLRAKIVAILVGPTGVGIISLIDQVVVMVAHVSAFGLPFAGIKYLSRAYSDGPEAFARLHQALLRVLATLTLVGAGLAIGLVTFRPSLLGTELLPYRTWMVIGLAASPALPLLGYFTNVFASLLQFRTAAIITFFSEGAGAVVAVLGIWLAGIMGFYSGRFIVGAAVVLGVMAFANRRLGSSEVGMGAGCLWELRGRPDIFRFSLVMYVLAFTGPVADLVARLVIAQHGGMAQVGLFQAVFAIGIALSAVLGQAGSLYLTPLMNLQTPEQERMTTLIGFQRGLLLIMAVVAMPIVVFPREMLLLLFSSAFVGATRFLFLFVLSECILLLGNSFQTLVIGFDQLRRFMVITVLSQVALAILAWTWVPLYGIWGVAVALILTRLGWAIGMLLILVRHHDLSLSSGPWLLTGYIFLVLGLAGLFGRTFSDLTASIALIKLVGCLVFFVTLGAFLTLEERDVLRRLGRHLAWSLARSTTRVRSKSGGTQNR